MVRAIYPGSFDPVTFGHLDVIRRAAELFDEVIVGVLNNSAKNHLFSAEERKEMLKVATKEFDNVQVISFEGLLVDYMKNNDISVIVRGLRAITDFDYELQALVTGFFPGVRNRVVIQDQQEEKEIKKLAQKEAEDGVSFLVGVFLGKYEIKVWAFGKGEIV